MEKRQKFLLAALIALHLMVEKFRFGPKHSNVGTGAGHGRDRQADRRTDGRRAEKMGRGRNAQRRGRRLIFPDSGSGSETPLVRAFGQGIL